MRKQIILAGIAGVLLTAAVAGCAKNGDADNTTPTPVVTEGPEVTPDATPEITEALTATPEPTKEPVVTEEVKKEQKKMTTAELEAKWKELYESQELTKTLKAMGYDTPVMTQRLGADPYAIVYEGRVYLYMTGDVVEYYGKNVQNNSYSKINKINVVSSDDLVNWTDHGTIYTAGKSGAATWGNNSWAPAACYKEIDGKMQFFLYFANGGNGIGVLVADSPVGPFKDPIKKALISRQTPNCGNVDWLFDPAVLVDDDGNAYIYFGGGVPAGKVSYPGTARVAKLGADMISLDGDPVAIDVPFLFEDSGINKIGDTYYYSYCSNWQTDQDPELSAELGLRSAEIAYMTSKDPMGPFTFGGVVLKNPGVYYGCYGNNHHCMFEFNDEWYITYHTQILEKPMGISGGYRCTGITKINVNEDGTISKVEKATRNMLKQTKNFDPYQVVQAETMATMGGLNTIQEGMVSKTYGSGNMVLDEIESGDWLALYGVDFGESGAKSFMASVRAGEGVTGIIQLRLDSTDGEVIGYLQIGEHMDGQWHEISSELLTTVTGVHNLVMVFGGEGYQVDYWQFSK